MKKVLGIIALVAICACSEKPKEATHPELSELNLWNCIDAPEYEYIMLNESGEPLPQITRYAWADIDGDGLAELFLGSKEGEAPEISAAFALGGKEPGLIGFADPSHSMYFYPEGVSTCGTGTSRYNYMDRRFRLQDSKIEWELTMEDNFLGLLTLSDNNLDDFEVTKQSRDDIKKAGFSRTKSVETKNMNIYVKIRK